MRRIGLERKHLEPFWRLVGRSTGYGFDEAEGRDVIVNPIFGDYGKPSHWWLSVQGSPPRGCVVIDARDVVPLSVFLIRDGFQLCRRLKGRAAFDACRFLDAVLAAAEVDRRASSACSVVVSEYV